MDAFLRVVIIVNELLRIDVLKSEPTCGVNNIVYLCFPKYLITCTICTKIGHNRKANVLFAVLGMQCKSALDIFFRSYRSNNMELARLS